MTRRADVSPTGVFRKIGREGIRRFAGDLHDHVVGRWTNQPITVDDLRTALGNEKVQELSRSLGIPADKLAEILAQHLPAAVDEASKTGALPAGR